MTVNFAEVPYISEEARFETEALDKSFYRIRLNYSFKEQPDVPAALRKEKLSNAWGWNTT